MYLECAMHKASGGEDSTALQLIATTALTVMDQEESMKERWIKQVNRKNFHLVFESHGR